MFCSFNDIMGSWINIMPKLMLLWEQITGSIISIYAIVNAKNLNCILNSKCYKGYNLWMWEVLWLSNWTFTMETDSNCCIFHIQCDSLISLWDIQDYSLFSFLFLLRKCEQVHFYFHFGIPVNWMTSPYFSLCTINP